MSHTHVLIAGLAYEYEFGGEAKTTVKGLSTPALSIKGSSGMLELGYIIQRCERACCLHWLAGLARVKSGMNSCLLPIPKLNDSDGFLEIPKTHILAN